MQSADFLIELGTEELPPKALKHLAAAFSGEFVEQLDAGGFEHGEVETFAAPRRLAFRVNGLTLQQPDRNIEKRGPAVKAAFDQDGQPTRAAIGFAQSQGLSVEQLERLETPKGEWLVAHVTEPGKSFAEVAQAYLEQAIHQLPIPKRMRWGAGREQFVRPVHWLVALVGDAVLPLEVLGLNSGRDTRGHRFHHGGTLSIANAADYEQLLANEGYVQVDFAKRRDLIENTCAQLGASAGGRTHMDADLLDEVTSLVEWPVPLLAHFEQDYLRVPQEALISTMEGDQKYFPVLDEDGRLCNAFVFVSNIESRDPAQVIAGNEKVVRPRLADAAFFYDQDCKKTLEEHAEPLARVVFQKQLGTLADKAERTAALASVIAAQLGGDRALAEKAARLAKADLNSGMVGEFDKMQGIMGRYLALNQGLPEELATALEEQYLPRHAGDGLPTTTTGQAVALADKLDTLVGIFGVGAKPSGTKDPFALRRAALGVLRIVIECELKLDLAALVEKAASLLSDRIDAAAGREALGFLIGRYRSFYRELGFSTQLIQAAQAVHPEKPLSLDRRLRALALFADQPACAALAAANKRVANILAKQDSKVASKVDNDLLKEPAEIALAEALDAQAGTKGNDWLARLESLATLRAPIDAFFDEVMVNAEDEALKRNRLALLAKLRGLFLQVADLSLLD